MDLEFADRKHFTVGLSDRELSVGRQVELPTTLVDDMVMAAA